jgi:hypothetical protein
MFAVAFDLGHAFRARGFLTFTIADIKGTCTQCCLASDSAGRTLCSNVAISNIAIGNTAPLNCRAAHPTRKHQH